MDDDYELIPDKWFGVKTEPYADPWYRFLRVIRLIDKMVQVEENSSWLDLGCHQGQFIKLLGLKYNIVLSGIDDWDQSNNSNNIFTYYKKDLSCGISLDEKYDFISALEVIEHMIDTDAFLTDCYEHLNDNGVLVLSTPNINSLRNRITVPLGVYPAGMEYKNIIHHVRLYNVAKMFEQLQEHRYRVIGCIGVNFLPVSMIRAPMFCKLSEIMADMFPTLCGNLILLAKKYKRK